MYDTFTWKRNRRNKQPFLKKVSKIQQLPQEMYRVGGMQQIVLDSFNIIHISFRKSESIEN